MAPDGTDRCGRLVGRRLHLFRAGARSAGPRYTPAERRAVEQEQLSYCHAPPGHQPGSSRWPARRSGHRPTDWMSRSGSLCTRFVGSNGGRAGLVGDADSRLEPATRRRPARLGRPRPVPPVGEQRQRLPGRLPETDGLPAAGTRPGLRLLPLYADLAVAAQPPDRRHHFAAGCVPELPDALRTVDVDIPTMPQFWRIPVTPVGQVPVANRPSDLTRPAEDRPWVARSDMFRYGVSEQVFRVRVHRVIASDTFTSLEWAIVSVTGGDGVEAASAPPFASADAATKTSSQPCGRERTRASPRWRTGPSCTRA